MLLALAALIGIPLGTGFLLVLFASRLGRAAPWISFFPPLTASIIGASLWNPAMDPRVVPVEWLPQLGISANLLIDPIGIMFVLLIGLIGLAVVQYSRYYFKKPPSPIYWGLLLIFMGAMLGFVLSESLLLTFLFWELTTMTSALLISHNPRDPGARRGAIQAFVVTGAGSLCLLAGILLLGEIAGSYNLSDLVARSEIILSDRRHIVALLLICTGAFTKSAQWPFHFWLPGAMAAPAPVSAYLHSATLVNAGVFLLGRFVPVFGNSPVWFPLLSTVGLITFFLGAWSAFRSLDLKELLAYSTVSYLGVLVTLYAHYPIAELHGELLHFLNHALYKSALFLLIGWFEALTGTREISRLDDEHWLPHRPAGALLFGIAALAMAGGPFLLGFHSKSLFFEQIVTQGLDRIAFSVIAFLGSVLTVAVAIKIFVPSFWGKKPPRETRPVAPWLLWIPCLLLLPQLIGGLAPKWFLGSLLKHASEWPGGISFWMETDLKTVLKLTVPACGLLVYFSWRKLSTVPRIDLTQRTTGFLVKVSLRFCSWFSSSVQAGGHPRYVAVALGFSLLFAAGFSALDPAPLVLDIATVLSILPAGLIAVACAVAVYARRRLLKVLMLAVSGYSVSLFFVLYRAPDLALTQILVELVLLILLLLAFRNLPTLIDEDHSKVRRASHFAVAIVSGAVLAFLTFTAGSQNVVRTDFIPSAVEQAKAGNIVNAILVDFRAADTLGELTVLAIAALGGLALLERRGA